MLVVKRVENILPYCGELLAGGVEDFSLANGSEFLSARTPTVEDFRNDFLLCDYVCFVA